MMTTTMPLTRARRGTRIALVLLELLIGANAVWGGIMLMADSWKLDQEWLDNTFFQSWLLPGAALLVIIGGTQLAWLQVFHPVMQPTMLVAGFLITALAWRLPSGAQPGGPAA